MGDHSNHFTITWDYATSTYIPFQVSHLFLHYKTLGLGLGLGVLQTMSTKLPDAIGRLNIGGAHDLEVLLVKQLMYARDMTASQ